jgi:hypothetical protein
MRHEHREGGSCREERRQGEESKSVTKEKNGRAIKVRTVIAAMFLFSFFVFTIGVVGYVIFLGGVQA